MGAYGAVLLDSGDLERAEVFVRAGVTLAPDHFLTRALEGLYLEVAEEEALSRESYARAFELFNEYTGNGRATTPAPAPLAAGTDEGDGEGDEGEDCQEVAD